MRELTDGRTRYESYAFMFVLIKIECRLVFLLRKSIRGLMHKIFHWKSKHKVKGSRKVQEETNS
jgi:hypothetical protein